MIRILILLMLFLPKIAFSEVIVNSGVTVDTVSREYLLSIFSMRTRAWPDGRAVRVFVLPERQPPHRKFVKQVLGIFPYQLEKAWRNAVFSGAGWSPTVVKDQREMLEMVGSTVGAIGYVCWKSFDEEGDANVKVLHVD